MFYRLPISQSFWSLLALKMVIGISSPWTVWVGTKESTKWPLIPQRQVPSPLVSCSDLIRQKNPTVRQYSEWITNGFVWSCYLQFLEVKATVAHRRCFINKCPLNEATHFCCKKLRNIWQINDFPSCKADGWFDGTHGTTCAFVFRSLATFRSYQHADPHKRFVLLYSTGTGVKRKIPPAQNLYELWHF